MKKINGTLGDRDLLMAYCQKEDKEYWRILYERYVPMVYGVVLKYLKQPEDARRAVLHLFDELMGKVASHPVVEFKSWLYACVRSYCLKELQRRSGGGVVGLDESVLEYCDDFDLDAVREETAKENRLQKCIETLPEKQRICVCRFFMENRSYKEIEDATGFSLKLIKSLIHNGKRNLKLCFWKKGIA